MTDAPSGDIEPTIKAWVISIFGDDVFVAYSLPAPWDWSRPVIVIGLVDETYFDIAPIGDVLAQFDCWAGPRDKAAAAGVKSRLLTALYGLETNKYADPDTGDFLSSAYGTHGGWVPDPTTTTGSTKAGPLPRYSVTTQLVTGKAPALT